MPPLGNASQKTHQPLRNGNQQPKDQQEPMRPKALQQQDLSQSMAHQEGYEDRQEKNMITQRVETAIERLEQPNKRTGRKRYKQSMGQ